jgi:chromosome segregation ATPase
VADTDGPWPELNVAEDHLRWKADNDHAWDGMADQRAYLQAALRLLDEARAKVAEYSAEISTRSYLAHERCSEHYWDTVRSWKESGARQLARAEQAEAERDNLRSEMRDLDVQFQQARERAEEAEQREREAFMHGALTPTGWCCSMHAERVRANRYRAAWQSARSRAAHAHRQLDPEIAHGVRLAAICDSLTAQRDIARAARDSLAADLAAARAEAAELGALIGTYDEIAGEDRAALARVRAYAETHADWCCAKGCTVPADRCDETCNCEAGAILAALDGTEPPPSVGHRAALAGPPAADGEPA